MTTNQLRIRFAGRQPARVLASAAALPLLLAGAAAAGVIAVSHPEWYRGTLAIALTVNLIIVAMKWPRAAALATLLFLPFLALVRRLLIADAGFASNDPLLLVGPVVALFVLYRLYVVEGRRSSDRLFKLVAALLVVAVVQVFNPLAVGGLIAAAGGLLFVGVPLLWFFVGRELGDRVSVTVLLYGTIVVGCIVAVYGLLQTQYGTITSWDQAWVDINGYDALLVSDSETGSVLRPFSTFSSNQEYAAFLSIAVTFVVAFLLRRRPLVVARASAARAGPVSRRRPWLARAVGDCRGRAGRAADAQLACRAARRVPRNRRRLRRRVHVRGADRPRRRNRRRCGRRAQRHAGSSSRWTPASRP